MIVNITINNKKKTFRSFWIAVIWCWFKGIEVDDLFWFWGTHANKIDIKISEHKMSIK